MPIIAVYARASRDREERRISTDRQVSRCTGLAEELFPGQQVRTFVDNDLSGADPGVERPAFNALLAAIRRGEVAELVAHEQSRLTRQPAQWDDLVITLTKAGITKVHTVQHGAVAVEAGNRLVGRIMAVIDAEEVERTKARALAAQAQLAKEGRPGSPPGYGYRRQLGDDGRGCWVVDKGQAKVVRRIADRLIAGRSVNAVIAELNAGGVAPPRRAASWSATAVRSVVQKPAIAGLRAHNGEIVGPGRWDAIITEERWRKVLRALGSATVIGTDGKRRHAGRVHRQTARRWLLTGGLARCGRCGGALVVSTRHDLAGRPSVHQYRCPAPEHGGCGKLSLAPAEVVESYVVERVIQHLESPKMAARLLDHPDPERARLLAELAEAEALMDEAAELRGQGVYDKARWERQFLPAKRSADAARTALAALPDPDLEVASVKQVRHNWEELPLRQRRAVLDRLLTSVEIGPPTWRGRTQLTELERVHERVNNGLRWRA